MQYDHNSENIKCEFDILLSKKYEVNNRKSAIGQRKYLKSFSQILLTQQVYFQIFKATPQNLYENSRFQIKINGNSSTVVDPMKLKSDPIPTRKSNISLI